MPKIRFAMRNILIIPICIFLALCAPQLPAQQVPFLNQYTWNPRLFNPAAQGQGSVGQIAAAYRSQFQDLEAADRPNTYLFHADMSPWMPERLGLAVQVMGDKAHLISRFQASALFGYHLIQQDQFRLSLGAAASWLTQNINFDGRRLSDILDLSVFSGDVNKNQFDGGPGLALEYQTAGGSVFALDVAATQLFSSDVRITGLPGNTRPGAVYDLVPHVLANARARIQGAGFAVEPTLAVRVMGGGKPVPAGVFDVNLNAYFLKENRLMVGAGIRSNTQGAHFQMGLAPAENIWLLASAELHPALGPSYEVGANYTFRRATEKPAAPAAPAIPPSFQENLLENAWSEFEGAATALEQRLAELKSQQQTIRNDQQTAAAARNLNALLEASDRCATQLELAANALNQARQGAQSLDVRRLQAEQTVRNAGNQGGMISASTRQTLKQIQERNAAIQGDLQELLSRQQALQLDCEKLRPAQNAASCIQLADSECLQNLFETALSQTPGRPANMYPVRCFSISSAAAITYHFPNDAEQYALRADQQVLAAHLAQQIRDLEQQGVRLDKIALVSELQEDRSTLGYRLGLEYDGSLPGTPPPYALVDNETGTSENKTLAVQAGERISLEALAALKLAAWRHFLATQGIPNDQISLEIRYNHDSNIYREETKVVLRLRN